MKGIRWICLGLVTLVTACAPARAASPATGVTYAATADRATGPTVPDADASASRDATDAEATTARNPPHAEDLGIPGHADPGADDPLARRGIRRKRVGAAAPPPDWTHVLVSLSVIVHTGRDGDAFVNEGATLRSGEELEFQVTVARPLYVCLVQVFPGGRVEAIYPEADEPVLLQPGITHRVPTDPGVVFTLDDVLGTEKIVLIASSGPLEGTDPALASVVRAVRATGRWPSDARPVARAATSGPPRHAASDSPARLPPDPSVGPAVAGPATRGGTVPTGSSGRGLDVKADGSPVQVQTFWFEHVP